MGQENQLTMGPWGTAGVAAGSGVIGGIMDLAFSGMKQRQQLAGQKKALEQQNAAQLDLWNKTNYSAQVAHMKEAGLNPGLLYGMGGAGGATTGSASAMPSAQGGGKGMDIMGAAQLALLNAQRENIQADTENKKADTVKTSGVDTQKTETEIGKMIAETTNEQQKNLLLKAQTSLTESQAKLAAGTLDDNIMMAKQQLEYLGEQAQILLDNGAIRKAYWGEYIESVRADWASKLIQNQATQAGISLTAAQMGKIQGELVKMQADIMNDRYNTDTNRMRFNLDQKIKDISDSSKLSYEVISNILKGVIILK